MSPRRTTPERCPCGGVILADCEDWRTPICPTCWDRLGCPEWEPLAPIRRVVGSHSNGRRIELDCGHAAERRQCRSILGSAWPCSACADRVLELAAALQVAAEREQDRAELARLLCCSVAR